MALAAPRTTCDQDAAVGLIAERLLQWVDPTQCEARLPGHNSIADSLAKSVISSSEVMLLIGRIQDLQLVSTFLWQNQLARRKASEPQSKSGR